MYPFSDPYLQLELHRQRTAELHRQAAADRLVREADAGRGRRFGRWPRASARPRPGRTPVTS